MAEESEAELLREIEELREKLYRLRDRLAPEPREMVEEVSGKLDCLVVELMKRRRARRGTG